LSSSDKKLSLQKSVDSSKKMFNKDLSHSKIDTAEEMNKSSADML